MHEQCSRCDGNGSESITVDASADGSVEADQSLLERILLPIPSVLGYQLGADTTITKTCEKCDGSGELHYWRDLRMDELKDVQIKTLTEADIYRVSRGATEDDMPDTGGSGPGGPTPSEAKARAMSGGNVPNI